MGKDDIKKHEFKKGQSGNPKGRPRGSLSLSAILKKYLDQELDITDPITKQQVKKRIGDIINLKLLAKAMQGDTKAIDMIYDRIEGKPIFKHEGKVEGDGTNIIILKDGYNLQADPKTKRGSQLPNG